MRELSLVYLEKQKVKERPVNLEKRSFIESTCLLMEGALLLKSG